MNFTISGHHVEVTPAIREYVITKLNRVLQHFDNIIDVGVILSVEKMVHKCEVTVHVSGKDIHVATQENNMYTSIDVTINKLDRQMVKHKEKNFAKRTDGTLHNITGSE